MCSYTEAPYGTISWEVGPYILLASPYPNSQDDSLQLRKLSCDLKGTCRTYRCRVQDDNNHIMDLFPLFDSVVVYRGLGSTPHKHLEYFLENYL